MEEVRRCSSKGLEMVLAAPRQKKKNETTR